MKDFSFKSKTRRKPGVWYGFQKPALVLANDVILLATPCLSEDCTKCVQWIESQLSASQPMFSDYELRLSSSLTLFSGLFNYDFLSYLQPNINDFTLFFPAMSSKIFLFLVLSTMTCISYFQPFHKRRFWPCHLRHDSLISGLVLISGFVKYDLTLLLPALSYYFWSCQF